MGNPDLSASQLVQMRSKFNLGFGSQMNFDAREHLDTSNCRRKYSVRSCTPCTPAGAAGKAIQDEGCELSAGFCRRVAGMQGDCRDVRVRGKIEK
jgi:hypothetical protein